jgi:hypothetical protein
LKWSKDIDSPERLNVQLYVYAKWNWWRLKYFMTTFTYDFPFHSRGRINDHSGIHHTQSLFCWTDALVLTALSTQCYFHW